MPLSRFKYPYSYDTIFLPTVTANNNLNVSGSASVAGSFTALGLSTFVTVSATTVSAASLSATNLAISGAITATNTSASGRSIHTFQNSPGSVFSIRSHGSSYVETLLGNSVSGHTTLLTTSGDLLVGTYTGNNLILGTNNAERMRLDSSGNALIGSTTNSNSDRLLVSGGSLQVTGATSSVLVGTDSGGSVSLGRRDNAASSPYIDFNTGATTVDYDVRVQATGGTGTVGQGILSIAGLETKFNIGLLETATVSATAAATTVTYDFITNRNILFYTSNATANWTINIRGNASVTLNSLMDVGQSLTVVFMNTNGASAFYATAFQIDGSAITPRWANGSAPTSGNASSTDVYTYTIIKTAATPTYVVLAAQTRFA